MPAKFWRLTGWTNVAPRNFNLTLRCIAFRIYKACYRRKLIVSAGNFILTLRCKVNRFAGKIDFVQKEPLKTAFLGWQKWTLLSLGGAGGQTVHNRSTFGAPLKTYGHNASNELCGRSVASKLWPQQADGLFYQGDTEIGENLHFFIKRSAPENFQGENFSKGVPTETLRTHGSEYVY